MAGNGSRQTKDYSWIEREFQDERLRKRFGVFLERLWDSMGQSIPFACQDWASTKAAYRLLSNERVNERDILSGHFTATADRFKLAGTTTLVPNARDGLMLIFREASNVKCTKAGLEYPSGTICAALNPSGPLVCC